MPWRAIVRFAVGTRHERQELPCQDYGAYYLCNNDVIVGAIADGAGSSNYSHIGAKLAVEKVITTFEAIARRNLNKKLSSSCPLNSEEARRLFTTVVKRVTKTLQEQADSNCYTVDELACTLLIVVAAPEWLVAMQIGDGFLVLGLDDKNYQMLFQPDKGEFANQTTFVTSSDAIEMMQVHILQGKQRFICASTDGLEKVAIKMSNWVPFFPFFKPLEEYLYETSDPEHEDDYIESFLNSERLNAKTDDDKTLLLCLYVQD